MRHPIIAPTVDAPFASWIEQDARWIGHPTLDAAAQYSLRRGIQPKVFVRSIGDDGQFVWHAVEAPLRPYGARSGRSYQARLVVIMPARLMMQVNANRGPKSKSEFVREALERYLVALRGDSVRLVEVSGRLVSCQDAHGERENVRNGTNEACKLCACSVAAPGCMLVP